MPVIKILPHPEYAPAGALVEAPAGTSICEALLVAGEQPIHYRVLQAHHRRQQRPLVGDGGQATLGVDERRLAHGPEHGERHGGRWRLRPR